MKRMDILFQINQLEEELKVTKSETKKVEVESQLRDLGQKLLSLTNSKRKGKKTKQTNRTPNQASKRKGDLVMDSQTPKTDNNLRVLDNDFLYNKNKKDMSEEEKNNCLSQLKSFDIEKIEQLREQGFTLGEMALQIGLQYQYFCQKRKRALKDIKKDADKKQPKPPNNKSEELTESRGKTIPLDEHIERTKEIKNKHKKETHELFGQINDLLAIKKDYETKLEELEQKNDQLMNDKCSFRKQNEQLERRAKDLESQIKSFKSNMYIYKQEQAKIKHLENLLILYMEGNDGFRKTV